MTPREYELYREGRTIRDDFVLDLLSWMQANLINIHIPRGKSRAKMEKIRPPKPKDRKSLLDELKKEADEAEEALAPSIPEPQIPDISDAVKNNPQAVWAMLNQYAETYNEQRRARESERESKRYWKTDEGRMMAEQFDVPEDQWQTPAQLPSGLAQRQRRLTRPSNRRLKN